MSDSSAASDHSGPAPQSSSDQTPGAASSGLSLRPVPGVPWMHEMTISHRLYRRELQLMPGLVRGLAPSERKRAKLIRRHYDLITHHLHQHHVYEDEHFWPVIAEREPVSAELAARMEAQHARVAELMAAAPPLWDGWVADPGHATAEPLVVTLSQLATALSEHLDEEERTLLPIMERTLTVQEWDAFGAYMGKQTTPIEAVRLGPILADQSSEQEVQDMFAKLPPVLVWTFRILQPFGRRHLRRIYGGNLPASTSSSTG